MAYLSQNKVKEYRRKHMPRSCPVLRIKTNDWVLDHDHQTGMVRGVISRQANSLLGKIENFYLGMCKGRKEDLPKTLRAIAKYLEKEATDVLHPVGLIQLTKRFKNSLTASEQALELESIGASADEINKCKNQKHRSELFRKIIKQNYDK
tara:strand:+ start:26 stop:475 length:450 start_codon:yes stop_codon:yes gene_type:complete